MILDSEQEIRPNYLKLFICLTHLQVPNLEYLLGLGPYVDEI